MANVIKEVKYILTEASTNNNKVWYGTLYDNGDVTTTWGRIGYSLQSKEFPGKGENFLRQKEEEKIKKGYTELKVIVGTSGNSSSTTITNEVKSDSLKALAREQLIKSKNPTLEKLIDRLVASNIHRITSNTKITYNADSKLFTTPLGIITLDAINDARTLLSEMSTLVKAEDFGAKFDSTVSRYMRLVPQNVGMRFSARNLFPDDNSLQNQLNILDSLEASYAAVTTTPKTDSTQKTSSEPKETLFKVDLDILNDANERYRLEKWFSDSNHTTHGYSRVKIINFYSLKIHDNWNNFKESLGNLKEVWHGTGEGNLLSLLKSGFKKAPPSTTHITGKLFSEGHYGALDSSKSLQYTYGRFGGNKGDSGWLIVADFALGNTYYIKSYGGSRPKGYDSIWAKKENTGLRFDELIVPEDNQARIKYLLEVK